MGKPTYPICDLLNACRVDKPKINIWDKAATEAEVFRLVGKNMIKDFLGNDVDEKLVAHQNTEPLETWTGSGPAPIVEAYVFPIGSMYAYLAYYFVPVVGKWTIKSFKKNENTSMVIKSMNVASKINLTSNPFKNNENFKKLFESLSNNDNKGTDNEE